MEKPVFAPSEQKPCKWMHVLAALFCSLISISVLLAICALLQHFKQIAASNNPVHTTINKENKAK